jgi:hypothetical protein
LKRFDFLKLFDSTRYKRRNMDSKIWIRKALSMCLMVATIATYSMVALANTGKVAGELLVSANNLNGETPFVKVNGEAAQSGRSIFSSSTVTTPENASAILNLGKAGKIELAPNSVLILSFNEKAISGNLSAGQVTVLSSSEAVVVNTLGGNAVKLNAGETATATAGKAQTDDDTSRGGGAWLIWALILGGAAAGIILAATSDNNSPRIGGGTSVISPTR